MRSQLQASPARQSVGATGLLLATNVIQAAWPRDGDRGSPSGRVAVEAHEAQREGRERASGATRLSRAGRCSEDGGRVAGLIACSSRTAAPQQRWAARGQQSERGGPWAARWPLAAGPRGEGPWPMAHGQRAAAEITGLAAPSLGLASAIFDPLSSCQSLEFSPQSSVLSSRTSSPPPLPPPAPRCTQLIHLRPQSASLSLLVPVCLLLPLSELPVAFLVATDLLAPALCPSGCPQP